MGLAYDTRHDKLVMFGSQYLVDHRTWIFDLRTSRWEALDLAPHPPAEKITKDYCTIPRLAYDSVHGIVLCLAWLGEEGHETWALDLGRRQWIKMSPAAEPGGSKSRSRNLAFDVKRNVFILETSSAKTNRPEIWTYCYERVPERDAAKLEAPTNLQVVTQADGKAGLTWTASSTVGVNEYRVYRGAGEDSWKVQLDEVATIRETRFDDEGLKPGQAYWYVVKAIGKSGALSPMSNRARTQPRVMEQPLVSVLDQNRIEVKWTQHPAADVIGYNLYRGVASVKTVTKGTPAAWRDNDPEYAEPKVVQVRDIVKLQKLNDSPITDVQYVDQFNLASPGPESGDYKYAVLAYIVRAVNKHERESGPSPYALTIPSEPVNVLCREVGDEAELKWDRSPKQGIASYHVYKLKGTWEIVRLTDRPIEANTFRHRPGDGPTRYWVVAVDILGQEGQPSSPAWFRHSYRGFFAGEWHQ
jgi:fibronectin type 3 domain-containing protein